MTGLHSIMVGTFRRAGLGRPVYAFSISCLGRARSIKGAFPEVPFNELQNYLRPRQRRKEAISLAEQQTAHLEHMGSLKAMLQTAQPRTTTKPS